MDVVSSADKRMPQSAGFNPKSTEGGIGGIRGGDEEI